LKYCVFTAICDYSHTTGFDSTGQYSYRLENGKKSVGEVILMRLKWKMAERKTEWVGTANLEKSLCFLEEIFEQSRGFKL